MMKYSVVGKCQGAGLESRNELRPLLWRCEDLAKGSVAFHWNGIIPAERNQP